ncbi:hypothetical protein BASA81_017078 [Batrachochytrium salamandrivorans]|nr:hypothetical protein BASA81_017078 [Batrachochytrium salamandrivorans]
MSLDVSGPVKNISEYSVTKVTQNDNGLRYTPVAKAGATKLIFHMDRSFISRCLTMMAVGPDGKLYSDEKKDEVAAFAKSWGVKDEDVLTNPRARTLIPPTQQLGTICKLPKNHRQNL